MLSGAKHLRSCFPPLSRPVAQSCFLGLRLFRSYRNSRHPSPDGRPAGNFSSPAPVGKAERRQAKGCFLWGSQETSPFWGSLVTHHLSLVTDLMFLGGTTNPEGVRQLDGQSRGPPCRQRAGVLPISPCPRENGARKGEGDRCAGPTSAQTETDRRIAEILTASRDANLIYLIKGKDSLPRLGDNGVQ